MPGIGDSQYKRMEMRYGNVVFNSVGQCHIIDRPLTLVLGRPLSSSFVSDLYYMTMCKLSDRGRTTLTLQ